MADNTYVKIATAAAPSGSVSNLTFSAIPSTYTDLMLIGSVRTTTAFQGDDIFVQFNSNASNYFQRRFYMITAAQGSDANNPTGNSLSDALGANAPALMFSNINFYVGNYASTTVPKTTASYSFGPNTNATRCDCIFKTGYWNDNSAITSIAFTSTSNIAQYSTITLYGIKNS
jgi:hypothetical protein